MPDLQKLLSPKSIAIIGSSKDPKKVGAIVLNNLQKSYSGKIFPIHPTEFEINNLKCYGSIKSLPELPDLVIIAIPVDKALLVLEEVGQQKIQNVLIYSAGFKETKEGTNNEEKLLEIAKKYDLNIIGPNCLGFLNNDINLNATFGEAPSQNGNLKILSQSGAIATSFFDWAQNHSLGINQFISLGNKSILNENHFLEFWSSQEKSNTEGGLSNLHPIGMYLESIADGQKLLEIAKQTTEPIFLLKPGKSPEAASAMKSHTGSLAGADDVLNQALLEANIIRANNLEEFFDLAKALSWENIPTGPNIAIISNAGGPGVISADAVANSSLKFAPITPETEKILAEKLPRSASLHNPIDVLGDALSDRFGEALDAVLKESEVNAVIVILTPQIMTEIKETAQIIGEKSQQYQKPIYCSFIGGSQVGEGEKILNKLKIPNFNFPENAIRTLSQVYTWKNTQHSSAKSRLPVGNSTILNPEIDTLLNGSGLLDTNSANQILDLLGLDTPSSIVTNNFEEASSFIEKAGWPVVLKTTQKDLLHKSDSGGVITDIDSFQKLKQSWLEIQMNPNDQIQVQKQVETTVEMILGFKRDSVFGDTLFLGAGGKLVNLFHDKNLALFPLTAQKIQSTLEHSQIYPLLTGYRNTEKLNVPKLIQDILKLANRFSTQKSIKEMEINPVIINTDGVFHVDPKIILN